MSVTRKDVDADHESTMRRATQSDAGPPLYKEIERILDNEGAWIFRPNKAVTFRITVAAYIAAEARLSAPDATPLRPDVSAGLIEAAEWHEKQAVAYKELANADHNIETAVAYDRKRYWHDQNAAHFRTCAADRSTHW